MQYQGERRSDWALILLILGNNVEIGREAETNSWLIS